MLAVPLDEVDLVLLPLDHLDQAVGDVLLGVGRDALDAAVVLEHDRAERVLLEPLRERRPLLGVDVLDLELLRHVLVLLEPRAEPPEVLRSREHRRTHRLGQSLEHLLRLIGERVLVRRRQVPALVVAARQIVDGREDAEHDQDARERQRAEARLASGELAGDLAPLAEHVEERADQPRQRERAVPLPFRPELRDGDRREDERDAEPAEKSENSFQHTSSRATARSQPTWPSGTGRT